jgi:LysM repeat protein
VDRICPFLALSDDGRTVVDGFDLAHRCGALTPPADLTRQRQVQLCLTEAHARCERFTAARTALLAASSGLPRVAPDVAFISTRQIIEPEPAWRGIGSAAGRRPPAGAGVLVLAVAAVVVAILAANLVLGGGSASTPTPTPIQSMPVSSSQVASPTTVPSASQPPSPTVASTSTTSPATSPTAAPTPRTYVVQVGDTLNGIAVRFGTTAAAIAIASGISVTDTIVPGQILTIP